MRDISSASSASIDGFALNIGAGDLFTLTSLHNAYDMAARLGNFSLFLSFDFSTAGPTWTVDTISNLTNTFKDEPAQYKVDGKPFVSTFEGASLTDEWSQAREKVDGGIFFVPDWSSLGPTGIKQAAGHIDGACEFASPILPSSLPPESTLIKCFSPVSFAAWPGPGETRMSRSMDEQYLKALNGSVYMMGVSPYFYTSTNPC
jgi:glucan endo-1,3-alpha-glucosidase